MDGSRGSHASLARRIALAVSAVAFVASVVSMPGIASADGQPPAETTPGPTNPNPPDIKVTSLGIVHHNHDVSNDGYLFLVENKGAGPANKLQIVKDATIRNESTDAFLRQDLLQFTHQTPLNPGQSFMVEVSCTAHVMDPNTATSATSGSPSTSWSRTATPATTPPPTPTTSRG
jgi:hypothetical protein